MTLVMAYLNGNHVPNLLRLRTLITKFIGTVCSVSAGLPMGPEGPMVHIGACAASVITYAQCSKYSLGSGSSFHCSPSTWMSCLEQPSRDWGIQVISELGDQQKGSLVFAGLHGAASGF